MTDLPGALRERLPAAGVSGVLSIVGERRAADDTRKLLVGMHDGANVETVLIPRVSGGRSELPSPLAGQAGGDGDEAFEDADAAAAVEDEEEEEESGTGTG